MSHSEINSNAPVSFLLTAKQLQQLSPLLDELRNRFGELTIAPEPDGLFVATTNFWAAHTLANALHRIADNQLLAGEDESAKTMHAFADLLHRQILAPFLPEGANGEIMQIGFDTEEELRDFLDNR